MGPFIINYRFHPAAIKWDRNFTYLKFNTQFVLTTTGIKNIIFDLGGVIINLAVEETYKAFATLSNIPLQTIKEMVHQHAFFREYEKGMLTDTQFRQHLRTVLNVTSTDYDLDAAWNAMLLDIPLERIKLLERLRPDFNLFLLSNTNNIHLQCFNSQVKTLTGHSSLDVYFHQAYYSHLVKMAKPDVEVYEFVIQSNQLDPKETIFLDDNKDNLVGANKAGIQTFHVQHPDLIFSLFQ
jgi:putative hydrolase of the HAD superfamily